MALYRLQFASFKNGALPVDWDINVIYYEVPGATLSDADMEAISAALVPAYSEMPVANGHFDLRWYDMGDPLPRPIKHHYTHAGTDFTAGPRQVALCLSYFATRNLPRQRGRLYIGPFTAITANTEIPAGTLETELLDFGTAISAIGDAHAANWAVYSVKDATARAITDLWVDNGWDTQRRRGLAATTRTTRTL